MQEYFRYFPVSRAERQWGLYVSGAGSVLNATPDTDYLAHPEPYYFRWSTGRRMAREYAIVYHPHSPIELESEATPLGVVPAGNFIVLCPGVGKKREEKGKKRCQSPNMGRVRKTGDLWCNHRESLGLPRERSEDA